MTARDFWAEVLAAAKIVDEKSYYQLLGLAADATTEGVRDAFAKRCAIVHPDRHGAETDPERRRALVTLQARFNEAYRVLSNPKRRADYDRVLEGGTLRLVGRQPPRAEIPQLPSARKYFEAGRDCERTGDRAGALMNYRLAIQLEPDSPAIRDALARLDGPPAGSAPAAAEEQPPIALPRTRTTPSVEHREDIRHPITLAIKMQCRSWDQFMTFYTRNLSKGGLFVKTGSPVEIGTPLQIWLALPDGRSLELAAEVAHVVPGSGMGARFVALDDERRAAIEELVEQAVAATAVPVAPPPPVQPDSATPDRRLRDEDLFSGVHSIPEPPPVDLSPGSAVDRDAAPTEGYAALEAGRYAEARQKLGVAAKSASHDPQLRAAYHLAAGLEAKSSGRMDEAREHFQTAHVFDSRNERVAAELRALRPAPAKR